MTLRDTLERFEREAARATSSHESVSVKVSRRDGFTHDAVTPRGLAFVLDEPVEFGGNGLAPDPAEIMLAAVGASLSVTLTAHAALAGVAVEEIEVELTASIDGKTFFHPSAAGRPGLLDTALRLTVTSCEPARSVRGVVRDALRVAPVFRSLKRRPRVTLVLNRSRA